MADLLLSVPPGVLLAVLGVVAVGLGGRFHAALGLVGAGLEVARLAASASLDADPTGAVGAFGADGLALSGAAAILLVIGLATLASVGGARTAPVRGPGFALVHAGLCVCAVQSNDLRVLAALLFFSSCIELGLTPGGDGGGRDPATGRPTASSASWRTAALLAIAGPSLVALGTQGRLQSGGGATLEWIGTPFAGDAPSTLLFLGLVVPLALPPTMGGATQALAAGPVRPAHGPYAFAGLLRAVVLIVALARGFSGTDALLTFGVVAAVLSPIVLVLGRQTAARRLAHAVHVALAVLVATAAIANEGAEDAIGIGLLGLAAASAGVAFALVFVTEERRLDPGLGPDGLARLFPTLFAFTTLSVLALAAVPGTLAFEGRALQLGTLAVDGAGPEALVLAAIAAPVAAFACLPLLAETFFGRGRAESDTGGGGAPSRRRSPLPLRVAVGLAAGVSVGLGVAPGAAAPLLPYGSVAGDRFPTSVQQVQLLVAGLLVAAVIGRVRARRVDSDAAPREASVS